MKNHRLILTSLLICSCFPSQPYIENRTSFVVGYFEFDEIKANKCILSIDSVDYARIDLYIPKAHLLTDMFRTDKQSVELYKKCCNKHNDHSDKDLEYLLEDRVSGVSVCSYPVSDFVSISLIGNTMWNSNHHTGCSLNDIAYFAAVSPNRFIQNNYTCFDYTKVQQSDLFNNVFGPIDESMCGFKNSFHYPIDMPVSELKAEDLSLLGPGHMCKPGGLGYEEPDMLYYPPEVPEWFGERDNYGYENSYDYNLCSIFIPIERDGVERSLTVTLTDENGTDYSTTVTIE